MDWTAITSPYREALLRDLEGLLRIPSVKDETSVSETAPFGQGIDQALSYMLALGEREGFTAKNVDHYAGHLELGQGQETLGILSHLDVVPADPDQWETAPFEPVITDGKLYARGALDDKGPTLMAFYAVKILQVLGLTWSKKIRLIYGTDEENDWGGVDYYFKKESMPDYGIVPDGIFPMIYAEKGVASLELTRSFSSDQILDLHCGAAFNVVPDRAQVSLQLADSVQEAFEAYLDQQPVTGSWAQDAQGLQTLDIIGQTAHAASPNQGHNAGVYLLHFLKTLDLAADTISLLDALDAAFFEDSQGQALGLAAQDAQLGGVTINLASLNIQDGQLRLGLNWRYPASYDFATAYDDLTHWVQELGLSTRLVSHRQPSHTDTQATETQILLETYRKHTGDQTPPLAIGGITYGRVFERGITFGPAFLGQPATLHQPNEYIQLDSLFKALEIYCDALYQLATVEGQAQNQA